jgi:hypothetical protein
MRLGSHAVDAVVLQVHAHKRTPQPPTGRAKPRADGRNGPIGAPATRLGVIPEADTAALGVSQAGGKHATTR